MMVKFFKYVYYWLTTALAAVVSFCFYPCRVYGRENVPARGGFILAANHESNIDPILVPVVCPRQIRFMAKESLFKNPILGAIIRFGGGFPVRRGMADRRAIKEFLDALDAGWPVIMFPQGTRGGMAVQAGVGFLAVKSGKPVVPVYIEGTDKVLPKGVRFPKRSPVKVIFGKPFTLPSNTPHAQAAETIMSAIFALKTV